MHRAILHILLLLPLLCFSGEEVRTISGTVKDKQSTEGLAFANILIAGTTTGTTTDENGFFRLQLPEENTGNVLLASYLGYDPDSVLISAEKDVYHFNLVAASGELGEVVISGTMTEVSKLESPIPVEVYSPTLFKKNPTPGIFEALGMVNGVQPQLNCNVCNTGDIHINGMEGPYTMVLIDGMPIVSSLSTVYGLSGIPNSMVKRIEIVKGPASTLYGSEAVGGLVNIITKDAASAPRLKLDIMGTSALEFNGDLSAKWKIGNTSSLLGVNGFWYNKIHDVNDDNFTDVTLQKRASVFNKWDFSRPSKKAASLAIRYIHEYRWGGETNYTAEFRGTDSIYGESIFTDRVELIGTYAFPGRENFRLEYSYNFHHQDSYYGTVKYFAAQHTAFAQLIWDKIIGKHNLLVGIPFRFIHYDDNTPATATAGDASSNNPLKSTLPGIFVQDEWRITAKFTTLIGLRYDHNNSHGNIFTPRLSFKYSPNKSHTLRLSAGNGYRVVNLFTEDHAALTGAREVVIEEELKPEQSWNVNFNYVMQAEHNKGYASMDASAFYTYFTNKIVPDFDSDPDLIIYDNLDGHAVSRGFSLNTDFAFTNGIKLLAGFTWMDVYQVDKDKLGRDQKTPQLFAPKFSGTFSASYTINKIGLSFDWTGRFYSPMHLPVLPNDYRPGKSPWFCLMNLQVTKKFPRQIELYAGVKNLLNFMPEDPIMRPFDPFDKNVHIDNPNGYTFDPSYNYAPVQGIKGFLGLRWTLQ